MNSDLGGDAEKVSLAQRHQEIMDDGEKAFQNVLIMLSIVAGIVCGSLGYITYLAFNIR
jgi:hypothetical protein